MDGSISGVKNCSRFVSAQHPKTAKVVRRVKAKDTIPLLRLMLLLACCVPLLPLPPVCVPSAKQGIDKLSKETQ